MTLTHLTWHDVITSWPDILGYQNFEGMCQFDHQKDTESVVAIWRFLGELFTKTHGWSVRSQLVRGFKCTLTLMCEEFAMKSFNLQRLTFVTKDTASIVYMTTYSFLSPKLAFMTISEAEMAGRGGGEVLTAESANTPPLTAIPGRRFMNSKDTYYDETLHWPTYISGKI